MNTLTFKTELIAEKIDHDAVLPIFDEYKSTLLGGFIFDHWEAIPAIDDFEPVYQCFIAGTENPFVISYISKMPFYITPIEDKDGIVTGAVLSETPLSIFKSVKILEGV